MGGNGIDDRVAEFGILLWHACWRNAVRGESSKPETTNPPGMCISREMRVGMQTYAVIDWDVISHLKTPSKMVDLLSPSAICCPVKCRCCTGAIYSGIHCGRTKLSRRFHRPPRTSCCLRRKSSKAFSAMVYSSACPRLRFFTSRVPRASIKGWHGRASARLPHLPPVVEPLPRTAMQEAATASIPAAAVTAQHLHRQETCQAKCGRERPVVRDEALDARTRRAAMFAEQATGLHGAERNCLNWAAR